MAKRTAGMAGIWLEESKILAAAKAVRDAGFVKADAITPYPVHGMEEALRLKRSGIPYVTFFFGLLGCATGVLFTWWTSAVDWPINVGGKPFFSLPAFIPIIFELTILFAALSSVAAMFIINRLPAIDPPIIDPDLTSHKFAIFIPEGDQGYDEKRIDALMRELGADEVKRMAEY